jgi:hypothetical protein
LGKTKRTAVAIALFVSSRELSTGEHALEE